MKTVRRASHSGEAAKDCYTFVTAVPRTSFEIRRPFVGPNRYSTPMGFYARQYELGSTSVGAWRAAIENAAPNKRIFADSKPIALTKTLAIELVKSRYSATRRRHSDDNRRRSEGSRRNLGARKAA